MNRSMGSSGGRAASSGGHVTDLLPDFVNERLDEAQAARVRAHLDACEACRTELRSWQSIREAAAAWGPAAATLPEGMAQRVMAAVAAEVSGRAPAAEESVATAGRGRMSARLGWLVRFVAAQAPLVRREIWPASAVVLFIGAALSVLTAAGRSGEVPGAALSLLAPLGAAVGVALIYGAENDPGMELALASPTSPRIVVVARLVLVLAWDIALALAASAVLAVVNGPELFVPIVATWLGPMLLLGCLVLLLSLVAQSSVAIGTAMVIWVVRSIAVVDGSRFERLDYFAGLTSVLDSVWQTSPLTLGLALVLLAAAVFLTPYREPFAARQAI